MNEKWMIEVANKEKTESDLVYSFHSFPTMIMTLTQDVFFLTLLLLRFIYTQNHY